MYNVKNFKNMLFGMTGKKQASISVKNVSIEDHIQIRKQINSLYNESKNIRLELLKECSDDDVIKIYTEVKDSVLYSKDHYLSVSSVCDKYILTYIDKKSSCRNKKYLNYANLYAYNNKINKLYYRGQEISSVSAKYGGKSYDIDTLTVCTQHNTGLSTACSTIENTIYSLRIPDPNSNKGYTWIPGDTGDIVAKLDEYGKPIYYVRDSDGILNKMIVNR